MERKRLVSDSIHDMETHIEIKRNKSRVFHPTQAELFNLSRDKYKISNEQEIIQAILENDEHRLVNFCDLTRYELWGVFLKTCELSDNVDLIKKLWFEYFEVNQHRIFFKKLKEYLNKDFVKNEEVRKFLKEMLIKERYEEGNDEIL